MAKEKIHFNDPLEKRMAVYFANGTKNVRSLKEGGEHGFVNVRIPNTVLAGRTLDEVVNAQTKIMQAKYGYSLHGGEKSYSVNEANTEYTDGSSYVSASIHVANNTTHFTFVYTPWVQTKQITNSAAERVDQKT